MAPPCWRVSSMHPLRVDKSIDQHKIDIPRFQRYFGSQAPGAPSGCLQQEDIMKKLVLETTSPFQGLAELVAYDEGLFAKEGIQIEWADRDEAGIKTSDTSIKDVKATDMFGSHGTLLEQGKADMYNACEWGNY